VQLYRASDCGSATPGTVAGQGAAVLSTGQADDTGNVVFAVPTLAVGTELDAVATSSKGTSAFSTCAVVAPAGGGAVDDDSPDAGKPDTATGTGFTPGEPVDGTLHSDPVDLGTEQASDSGDVTFAFTIPKTLPSGQHYVFLTGQQSGVTVAIPVTVHTKPSAPRSLHVSAGKASARLTWSAPRDTGALTISGYRVYRSTDRKHWTRRTTAKHASFTDTRLAGGTRYYYEITAVNSLGASTAGTVVSAVPYTAPSAPRSLRATSGAHAITLKWTAPKTSHGASITSYVVEYATCRIGGSSCHPHAVTVKSRSRKITKLVAGRRYYLAVLAVNRAGRGPLSGQVSATPKR
jgi:hypothetical protein